MSTTGTAAAPSTTPLSSTTTSGTTSGPASTGAAGAADALASIQERHLASGFGELADVELVDVVARRLATPREQPADSFVLHAPLELTARAALLPFVRPAERDRARLRLTSLLEGYERSGPAVSRAVVTPRRDERALPHAAAALVDAIDAGELDRVDDLAAWLGQAASPDELQRLLAAAVLPRLAAAAHAPIFLYHLPRVAPRGEITPLLLRGLARELARHPDWRLHWIAEGRFDAPRQPERATSRPEEGDAPAALFAALASTPLEPDAERFFIFPTMAHVDRNGTAAALLADVIGGGPATPGATLVRAEQGRAVLRAAAWSMLLEPDDHAPYGWSHCLTLPQAALGIAPASDTPAEALATAATYVVGFRSALAQRPLVPVFERPDPRIDLRQALDDDPTAAAAAVWHARAPQAGAVVSELATRAATHHDAHLVKYTLACIDAAADDPAHARLFLAAAAHLCSWWIRHGNPEDPFAE